VQEPHKELIVEARSRVKIHPDRSRSALSSLPWEESAQRLAQDFRHEALDRASASSLNLLNMHSHPSPQAGLCVKLFGI
jgi:hypothetical protein